MFESQRSKDVKVAKKVKDNKIPYIVVLTDPTTGGVCASFAMLGDVLIAEKDARKKNLKVLSDNIFTNLVFFFRNKQSS